MRILIVEDDPVIAENLEALLTHNHYVTDIVHKVEDAFMEIDSGDYDAVILDWMLPDGSGIEICKQVREDHNNIPILMLTAKTQTDDIVAGLEQGADEYITKPYRAPELLARLQALLRRKDTSFISTQLQVGPVIIDTKLRTVIANDKEIALSPKEFDLLLYLFQHKNEPVDRLTVLAHIWGGSIDTFSNTVDVHIRYIRKKLGNAATILKTIKAKGYCVCEEK